jgi:uncharacterized membrane protein YfcA
MPFFSLFILIVVFFFTSILSVVTGSTSLITVPAMLQLGIAPRTALATNMFALILMSAGATLPYLGKGKLDRDRLPLLIGLTLLGSVVGALLVLVIPVQSVPLIISIAMIAVTIISVAKPNLGMVESRGVPSRSSEMAGYGATFALGIYGGFFSGGYVTMLTAVYVLLFRLSFVEAIATTKLINIFSSLVATVIFALRGLVDYRLGMVLGIIMFIGGIVGSNLAIKLDNRWLRRIFLITVDILAIKLLIDSVNGCSSTADDKSN